MADNDVVEERNAQDATGGDELARDREVGGGGGRVAGGVVVRDDDGGCREADGLAEDLAGMREHGVHSAARDGDGRADEAVSAVEREDEEGLAGVGLDERGESPRDVLRRVHALVGVAPVEDAAGDFERGGKFETLDAA